MTDDPANFADVNFLSEVESAVGAVVDGEGVLRDLDELTSLGFFRFDDAGFDAVHLPRSIEYGDGDFLVAFPEDEVIARLEDEVRVANCRPEIARFHRNKVGPRTDLFFGPDVLGRLLVLSHRLERWAESDQCREHSDDSCPTRGMVSSCLATTGPWRNTRVMEENCTRQKDSKR